MTLRARIIIGAVLLLALIGIINMVRKRALELKYSLAWILCELLLLIFVLFPGCMNSIARILGIYTPVNMIFFLGFVFSLIIVFSLTVALSRVTARVRKLAQMIALGDEEGNRNAGKDKPL